MQERRSGAVVSLYTAVQRVFDVVYRDEPPSAERVASLANAVAAIVPVYAYDEAGELRAVPPEELRDAKVDLARLFISRTSVEHAIEMLKARDDPAPPRAGAPDDSDHQRSR